MQRVAIVPFPTWTACPAIKKRFPLASAYQAQVAVRLVGADVVVASQSEVLPGNGVRPLPTDRLLLTWFFTAALTPASVHGVIVWECTL
jgi:hypothetical protein